MRGRWLRLWFWLIASAVLGCAPAPSPTPALTPPPVPVDIVPWPDIVWSTADGVTGGQADDAESGEMVAAVVAGAEGFVAVGYRENDGVRDGLIWYSADGVSWTSVGPRGALDAVELVDVAQAPDGFVALGIGSLGAAAERPNAVFLRSRDGRSWDRLGQVAGSADTYPAWLAGGADGVVAAGTDADGAPAVWRSPDGRSFERVAINVPADLSVIDPQATDGGYLALGGSGGPPVLLRSSDAVRWTGTQIDVAADVYAARLIPGHWGLVVQGAWAPTCAANASCPASAIGWWSQDGSGWGRLPGDGSPISNGGSIVVPAGTHGLLAIDGASAWASADGWAWRALPEPGDGSMLINDAVVLGNVIVAVGAAYGEDGISRGAIVVAK